MKRALNFLIIFIIAGITVEVGYKLVSLYIISKSFELSDRYTVIVHNCSNDKIDGIEILYGDKSAENTELESAGTISLLPAEYKKVNIYYDDFMKHPAPHNVYVSHKEQYICTGYYDGYGEVELVDIDGDGKLYWHNHDKEYKSIRSRHKRNADEISWF